MLPAQLLGAVSWVLTQRPAAHGRNWEGKLLWKHCASSVSPEGSSSHVQPSERLSSPGKERVLSSLYFMAVYDCFVIITTTTIIIRAVRALKGWKGTKPCRFSQMFKSDELEPSRFNPQHRCPLSPYRLPSGAGSLPLPSACQPGTGIPWGFSREDPAVAGEDVSETHWTFVDVGWGSWIIRSSAQAKPEWVWESAQRRAGLGLQHWPLPSEISGWKSPFHAILKRPWRH